MQSYGFIYSITSKSKQELCPPTPWKCIERVRQQQYPKVLMVNIKNMTLLCMYDTQCDAYVVNPFGNSNGLYIPNIFDNKQSKYHFDSKNSKKLENPENIESGSKIRIRKFREIFFWKSFLFQLWTIFVKWIFC